MKRSFLLIGAIAAMTGFVAGPAFASSIIGTSSLDAVGLYDSGPGLVALEKSKFDFYDAGTTLGASIDDPMLNVDVVETGNYLILAAAVNDFGPDPLLFELAKPVIPLALHPEDNGFIDIKAIAAIDTGPPVGAAQWNLATSLDVALLDPPAVGVPSLAAGGVRFGLWPEDNGV